MSSYIEKKYDDGREIIVLKTEEMEVWFTNLGAAILKLLVKDRQGTWQDVAAGYASLDDYPKYRGYLGAVVGRTANRIAKGQFTLNGVDYQLPINNGPNCNHGGVDGFAFRLFTPHLGEDHVTFTLHSPDGEEGYPGNMDVKVTYTIDHTDLIVHYEAESDADTLASFTNHNYFNLSGHPTYIGDHELMIHADAFGEVDGDTLFTGTWIPVEGTPMDFRTPAPIAQALEANDARIDIARGIDHSFLLNDKEAAVLYCPQTGLELTVKTTLPQMQVYTANWFDGEPGKYGEVLGRQTSVALETQNTPNDINLYPDHPATLLKKGEKLDETTVFSFNVRP